MDRTTASRPRRTTRNTASGLHTGYTATTPIADITTTTPLLGTTETGRTTALTMDRTTANRPQRSTGSTASGLHAISTAITSARITAITRLLRTVPLPGTNTAEQTPHRTSNIDRTTLKPPQRTTEDNRTTASSLHTPSTATTTTATTITSNIDRTTLQPQQRTTRTTTGGLRTPFTATATTATTTTSNVDTTTLQPSYRTTRTTASNLYTPSTATTNTDTTTSNIDRTTVQPPQRTTRTSRTTASDAYTPFTTTKTSDQTTKQRLRITDTTTAATTITTEDRTTANPPQRTTEAATTTTVGKTAGLPHTITRTTIGDLHITSTSETRAVDRTTSQTLQKTTRTKRTDSGLHVHTSSTFATTTTSTVDRATTPNPQTTTRTTVNGAHEDSTATTTAITITRRPLRTTIKTPQETFNSASNLRGSSTASSDVDRKTTQTLQRATRTTTRDLHTGFTTTRTAPTNAITTTTTQTLRTAENTSTRTSTAGRSTTQTLEGTTITTASSLHANSTATSLTVDKATTQTPQSTTRTTASDLHTSSTATATIVDKAATNESTRTTRATVSGFHTSFTARATPANSTTARQPVSTPRVTGQNNCSFIRCPSTVVEIPLPENRNFVEVDFRDHIGATDADSNDITPEVEKAASENVKYPITEYEVGPDQEPPYLFELVRFRACDDTCDVSVVLEDHTAPQPVSCPTTSKTVEEDSCRDVKLYDYYNSSTIESWFRDNVGINSGQCTRTAIDHIEHGETRSVTCYATDMAGSRSAGCDVSFHCKKYECPIIEPPEFGAIVCHEEDLMERCTLFCKEGKIHKRKNTFKCNLANPSSTWTDASIDNNVVCRDVRGTVRYEKFTFNKNCDPDDLDFHLLIKQTLLTRSGHGLCQDFPSIDCDIKVSCGYSSTVDTTTLVKATSQTQMRTTITTRTGSVLQTRSTSAITTTSRDRATTPNRQSTAANGAHTGSTATTRADITATTGQPLRTTETSTVSRTAKQTLQEATITSASDLRKSSTATTVERITTQTLQRDTRTTTRDLHTGSTSETPINDITTQPLRTAENATTRTSTAGRSTAETIQGTTSTTASGLQANSTATSLTVEKATTQIPQSTTRTTASDLRTSSTATSTIVDRATTSASTRTTVSGLHTSFTATATPANSTTSRQPVSTPRVTGQNNCSFIRCPSTVVEIPLPENRNFVEVNFRDYIAATDADSNEITPEVEIAASENVKYPITKYEVGPDQEPPYVFQLVRFRACDDTCDVSVVLEDHTVPQPVSYPTNSQTVERDSCRDVKLYDYYNSSTIESWFRDNVGIKSEQCTPTTIGRIGIGETRSVTCYATDMAGSRSAGCDVTFYCKKYECPIIEPPEFGAIVCHEEDLMERCTLFCKEGKIHKRKNTFECNMAISSTWIDARIEQDVVCRKCPIIEPPEFGAIVCHEEDLMGRCTLFCKEGKIHRRQNTFECNIADSATWTGARIDKDVVCTGELH
ncbi:PREDICTED: mucin-5AC-like [Branchiostoma belcheri]|uniref:Mucin-5AC-like n=1 Tax=Branchiostoma belcheri TaxID=7741 RepID=A0A6P4XXL1_BRABE|nr:PREDICTED: mucin-5AC-like [Branchiostoma belcheri]